MKILVACEFSGVVRDAFTARGHEAWSCDILPSERGEGQHIQKPIQKVDKSGFDMMIAFPPCTHLCVSGARWFKDKQMEQRDALAFVCELLASNVRRIALENPIGIISTKIRKPDQIIQPFHFGDPFRKATCLWLKNLPKLVSTNDLGTGEQACWRMPPSPNRAKERSRTYPGIAEAMAEQWGNL